MFQGILPICQVWKSWHGCLSSPLEPAAPIMHPFFHLPVHSFLAARRRDYKGL